MVSHCCTSLCGFGYAPTFGDMAPFKTHALFLKSELDLLLWLHFNSALRISGLCSSILLRVGRFVFLPLTATCVACFVVGVGIPFHCKATSSCRCSSLSENYDMNNALKCVYTNNFIHKGSMGSREGFTMRNFIV